jgi:multiple sugar transport system permease protein
VLTEGGPLRATETLAIQTYEQAFKHFRFSYAAAIGVVTLGLCLVISRAMMHRAAQSIY